MRTPGHEATGALFEPDGPDRFAPTALAAGPWSPSLQAGAAVVALAATLLEQRGHDAEVDAGPDRVWRAARVTADFPRPVPMARLHVAVDDVRHGRRLHLLGADVRTDDDVLVARLSLLRLAAAPDVVTDPAAVDPPAQAGPTDLPAMAAFLGSPGFFDLGTEVRVPDPELALGWGSAWLRPAVEVWPGAPISPFAALAAAADFANAVGAPATRPMPGLPPVTFLNADLTVVLAREPTSPWVSLSSRSPWAPDGTGRCVTALGDEVGGLGDATANLVLAARTDP